MTLAAAIEIGPGMGSGSGPGIGPGIGPRVESGAEQSGAAIARSPRSSSSGEGFRSGWESLFATPGTGPGIDAGAELEGGNLPANAVTIRNAAVTNGLATLPGSNAGAAAEAGALSPFAAKAKDSPPAPQRQGAAPQQIVAANALANPAGLRSAPPSEIESPPPAQSASGPASARPEASRNSNQGEDGPTKSKHLASAAAISPANASLALPVPIPIPAIAETTPAAGPKETAPGFRSPAGTAHAGHLGPGADLAHSSLDPKANAAASESARSSPLPAVKMESAATRAEPATSVGEPSASAAIAPRPHISILTADSPSPSQPAGGQAAHPAPKLTSKDEAPANGATASRSASTQAALPVTDVSSSAPSPGEKTLSRPAHESSAASFAAPAHHVLPGQSIAASQPGTAPARDPATPQASFPPTITALAAPRNAFMELDAEPAGAAPTWVHAGAQHAEAGFEDPSLGWVGVRADLGAGSVHASLVPGSADAAAALGTHLAGLNAYLAEHHNEISTVTLASPESRSLQGGTGEEAGRESHQGFAQSPGHGAGQNSGEEARQGSDAANQTSSQAGGQIEPEAIQLVPPVAHRSMDALSPPPTRDAGTYISVMA